MDRLRSIRLSTYFLVRRRQEQKMKRFQQDLRALLAFLEGIYAIRDLEAFAAHRGCVRNGPNK